ncbi:hypothetical protein DMUE_2505 [Dictyocoela muelleri]|nr:hypothetical protein DMUE_2505 [Dictyocoela muelleri]
MENQIYKKFNRKIRDSLTLLLFMITITTISEIGFYKNGLNIFIKSIISSDFLYYLKMVGIVLLFLYLSIIITLILIPEFIIHTTILLFPILLTVFSLILEKNILTMVSSFFTVMIILIYFSSLRNCINEGSCILKASAKILICLFLQFFILAILMILINFIVICSILYCLNMVKSRLISANFFIIILSYWNIRIMIRFLRVFMSSYTYLHIFRKKNISTFPFLTSIFNSLMILGSIIISIVLDEIVHILKWLHIKAILYSIPDFHKIVKIKIFSFIETLFEISRKINDYSFVQMVVFNESYLKSIRKSFIESKKIPKKYVFSSLTIKFLLFSMANTFVLTTILLVSIFSGTSIFNFYERIVYDPDLLLKFIIVIYIFLVGCGFIAGAFDSAVRSISFAFVKDGEYMKVNYKKIYDFLVNF